MSESRKLWFGDRASPSSPAGGTYASSVLNDSAVPGGNVAAALATLQSLIAASGVVASGAVATDTVVLWADNVGGTIKQGPSIGTGANQLVQLNGAGKLPPVDGSLLTNLPGGVSDHGALTGLADDDHPQYHNNARGDARYPVLSGAYMDPSWLAALAWSKVTATPTTIAGYGITDFNSLGDARWSLLGHTHTFASLTSKPTTLSGYGITDATPSGRTLTINGVAQTLAADRTWTIAVPATFVDLTDTPASYAGSVGYLTRVNATGTGLEFIAASALSIGWSQLTGVPSTFAPSAHLHPASEISDSTTVGRAILTLSNPSAIRFLRLNADNTVSARTAAEIRSDLSLGTAALVNTGTGAGDVPTITQADARYAANRTLITYTGGGVSTTSTTGAEVHSSARISVPAAGTWRARWKIIYDVAATGTGSVWYCGSAPANTNLDQVVLVSAGAADRAALPLSGVGAGSGAATSASTRASTNNVAIVDIDITTTASGSLQLWYASEVAGSAVTVVSIYGWIEKVF